MVNDDQWPAHAPLPSVDLDALARGARMLDDYRLDELIAVYAARRNVAAAHGLPGVAGTWHDALAALADVRRERTTTRETFADLVCPLLVAPD